MKKLLHVILTTLLASGLMACSPNEGAETPKKNKSYVFVTDTGGLEDRSFNQTSWEGLTKYAKEAGLKEGEDYSALISKTESDYLPNLTAFAGSRDLIIAAGFLFADTIAQTAEAYPNQNMLIIDVESIDETKYPNVQQAVFNEHEGSYLVGVAAAEMAKQAGKDAVGFIIGMESETMNKFWAGYQQGVYSIDPEMKILYTNLDSFDSEEKGKSAASLQYEDGAHSIFHAAGAAGMGVIKEAADRREAGKDVWVIGVDTDQYQYGIYGDENKSAVLTSMLKRVDTASYNAAKAIAEGTFKGGIVRYSLKDGGVGIPEVNPNLPEDVKKKVDEAYNAIKDGSVVVKEKYER